MAHTSSLSPATVVFCDVVAFSVYPGEKQHQVISSLNAEVAKELFPLLGMQGTMPKTICVPTGDGLLIVILEHSEPQILFSLIMSLRLWADAVTQRSGLQPTCKLRIGVHFGKVSIIPDINRLPNVCGDDINTCRRIMDQARPNQVLFSTEAHEKYLVTGDGAFSVYPFSKDQPAICGPPTTVTVKHDVQLKVHVMTQQGTSLWSSDSPLSAPRVIEGPEAVKDRTQIIIAHLRDLLASRRTDIRIYEQATFSSFAIERKTEEMRRYNFETIELLQEQKRLFVKLIKKKGTIMKVVLGRIPDEPQPQYPEVNIRYQTLAAWMDAKLDVTKGGSNKRRTRLPIEFLELPATDSAFELAFPNRLVVKDSFRIDGYRLRGIRGHGLSLVYYDEGKISQAANEIEMLFSAAGGSAQNNRAIREKLRVFEGINQPEHEHLAKRIIRLKPNEGGDREIKAIIFHLRRGRHSFQWFRDHTEYQYTDQEFDTLVSKHAEIPQRVAVVSRDKHKRRTAGLPGVQLTQRGRESIENAVGTLK